MKDYGTITNAVGVFPDATGKNSTSPGLFDGTPWIKQVIDDMFGANQALMQYAGLTPDGVDESASASQRLEAMKLSFGSAGEGVIWWGAEDPATLGRRILLLEGQFILCADYPELVEACYVGDSENGGNASRVGITDGAFMKFASAVPAIPVNDGIYFKLPDARGRFIRDLSNDSSANVDGNSYPYPGYLQNYASMKHEHWLRNTGVSGKYLGFSAVLANAGGSVQALDTVPTTLGELPKTGNVLTNSSGTNILQSTNETRPNSIFCRLGIRY